MLDLALNHEDELRKLFRTTWFSEKYMFYSGCNWYNEFSINNNNTDTAHQFVSLDKDGEIIGYIAYYIDREDNVVTNLGIINFRDDNKPTFGMDVGTTLRDIFEKFHFRKVMFYCVVGNPIESTYDSMIKKHNGRIVGIFKEEVRLFDGKYYDKKLYEILSKEYFNEEVIKDEPKSYRNFRG